MVPGDWSSRISRQSAHESGKVVSPTYRPPLPPRGYSWYSFVLEAESTPGPQCGRKDYVNEKLQWYHRESSAVPQPTAPPRTPHCICITLKKVLHKCIKIFCLISMWNTAANKPANSNIQSQSVVCVRAYLNFFIQPTNLLQVFFKFVMLQSDIFTPHYSNSI